MAIELEQTVVNFRIKGTVQDGNDIKKIGKYSFDDIDSNTFGIIKSIQLGGEVISLAYSLKNDNLYFYLIEK